MLVGEGGGGGGGGGGVEGGGVKVAAHAMHVATFSNDLQGITISSVVIYKPVCQKH